MHPRIPEVAMMGFPVPTKCRLSRLIRNASGSSPSVSVTQRRCRLPDVLPGAKTLYNAGRRWSSRRRSRQPIRQPATQPWPTAGGLGMVADAVRRKPVSTHQIPCYQGKEQGISSISVDFRPSRGWKARYFQKFTRHFPKCQNREVRLAEQGI